MTAKDPDPGRWPLELARLQAALENARGPERETLRGTLWRLLFEGLMRHLRFHVRGARAVERADLEDISSEKALELLARAESGAWNLTGRTASEISGYVSSAARFGWIDLQARRKRESPLPETHSEQELLASLEAPRTSEAEDGSMTRDLVAALRDCVEQLPARGRRVWFFRTFYAMSGREIAAHPLVRLNAPHVDVLVQRTRVALRQCLDQKGQRLDGSPLRAFVELWDLLESLAAREGAAVSETAHSPDGGRDDA